MSACSICAITCPLRTRVPSSNLSARDAAADLHADVAAVPRDDVAGGDEHGQGLGPPDAVATICVTRATSTSGARCSSIQSRADG